MIRRLGAFLPWILLLLFALRGLAAMRVDGATADEPLHLAYGERALHSGTFLREDDRLNSKMPVSMLNAFPVAIARHAAAPRELAWPRTLFLARLPSLLLGLLLGVLVWRWARELFGDRAGALALFLYTFCPNVNAHSHLVTTDIGTTLAMFAATYAFWRYTTQPSRGRLLIAAAAFGLAQLTKVTALFLGPIFVLILLVRLIRLARTGPEGAWSGQAARDLGALLALAAGLLVALNAGFLGEGTLTPLEDYRAKGYAFVSPTFQALAATPGCAPCRCRSPSPTSRGSTWSRATRAPRGGPSARALQRDGVPLLLLLGLPGEGADRHPAPAPPRRRALGVRPAAGPGRRGVPDRAGALPRRLLQPPLPARHRPALPAADLPLPLRLRRACGGGRGGVPLPRPRGPRASGDGGRRRPRPLARDRLGGDPSPRPRLL